MKTSLVFDIEADGLLETITKIHCIVTADLNTGEVNRYHGEGIENGLEALSKADELIGHNIIKYDIPAIKLLYPGFNPKGKAIDTLVISKLLYSNMAEMDARAIAKGVIKGYSFTVWDRKKQCEVSAVGRHSLEAWGKRLGSLKGTYGRSTDWSEFSEEMLDYCQQDVELNKLVYTTMLSKHHSQDAIDLEMEVQEILRIQVENGVEFDEPAAKELYAKLCGIRSDLQVKLRETFKGWDEETKTPEYYSVQVGGKTFVEETKGKLEALAYAYAKENNFSITKSFLKTIVQTGPIKVNHIDFNPGSRHHVCRVLKEKYNWEPTEFTEGGDAKVDETILEKLEYPEAQLLNEYFMIIKRIGQLGEGNQSWLGAVKSGRIHGSIDSLGTGTGRCTHSYPNISQVVSSRKPFGKECRSLFIVKPGYKFVSADLESLEMCTAAIAMEKYDGGEFGRKLMSGNKKLGTDAHTLNMKAFGVDSRDTAKTCIYALIYGCSGKKMGLIIGKSEKEGTKVRTAVFKTIPALKRVIDENSKCHELVKHVVGLDGRRISTRSGHSATNFQCQGMGAIIAKRWMVIVHRKIREQGLEDKARQVLFIHDELNFEVKEEYAQRVADILTESIKEVREYYSVACELKAEAHIGDNWYEVH